MIADKGLIEKTRCIGYAYYKNAANTRQRFNTSPRDGIAERLSTLALKNEVNREGA
jgi:hypothetical protein